MNKDQEAVNTTQPAAVETTVVTSTTPAVDSNEDVEAKIAALEADKAKAIEEAANWKVAALKAKSKKPEEDFEDETEEERISRIVNEKMAATKIAAIDSEKEALLKKLAKENKELKLANANKTVTPVSTGTHSEGQVVKDTIITPEQSAAFKARGWTEKDIERYKKNLQKYGGR